MDVLKAQGNQAFAQRNYQAAVDYYTKAIALEDANAVLFSNRAMSFLKLQDYHNALKDCDEGLRYVNDPSVRTKLLFRKASAFKGMGSPKLARQYFQQVLELDPKNAAVQSELNSLGDGSKIDNGTERVEIPIERVSKLPEEFQRLVNGKEFREEPKFILKAPEHETLVNQEIDELFKDRPKRVTRY